MSKIIRILSVQNFLVAFIFFVCNFNTIAQNVHYEEIMSKQKLTDSSCLDVNLQNVNFFKNNEYFHLTDGYTLIGSVLKPNVIYRPFRDIELTAGAHLLKYSGLDKFSHILPFYRVQYSPNETVSLIFGNVFGGLSHKLVEPLFSQERFYTNKPESGFQLIVKNKRFFFDTWIEWENFIFEGDPSQEELFGGISSSFNILHLNNALKFNLIAQFSAFHRGGQIDSCDRPLQTLINTSAGIAIDWQINHEILKNIQLKAQYISYKDASSETELAFESGHGKWFEAKAEFSVATMQLFFWQGDKFISPKGDAIFMSDTETSESVVMENKKIIGFRPAYRKKIHESIVFSAGVDFYYETISQSFDYSYGVSLLLRHSFLKL